MHETAFRMSFRYTCYSIMHVLGVFLQGRIEMVNVTLC